MATASSPPCLRGLQSVPDRRLVEACDLGAVGTDAGRDLQHIGVEHGRKTNIEVEEARPRLIADAQQITEALVDDEQHGRAASLQQRVGGDRRAHAHLRDRAGRDRRSWQEAENIPDAGDCGVLVLTGILRKELARDDATTRVARDDVRERAAAIDPELPRPHRSAIRKMLLIGCRSG